MHRYLSSILALAAVLALSSCSDDPVGPGGSLPVESTYKAQIDFYSSPTRGLWTIDGQVYAFGDAAMRLDPDGQSWQPTEVGSSFNRPSRLWGNEDAVYMYDFDHVFRFDGHTWESTNLPYYMSSVDGTEDGEMFGCYDKFVLHYDGAQWSSDSVTSTYLNNVTVGGPNDVYVVGERRQLFHYDGSDWTLQYSDEGPYYRSIESAWKCPNGLLYLTSNDTLMTFDGVSMRSQDLADLRARSVWGRSATEVYCAANGNGEMEILEFDGSTWTRAGAIDYWYVDAIWRDHARGHLYVAADQRVWKVEPTATTPILGESSRALAFTDLWRSEEGNVYAVGESAFRYDGHEWTDLKKEELTLYPVYSVWGRNESEIYAVGPGMILHYDGESWIWVSGGADHSLFSVCGNRNEVFAVGDSGFIVRYDGHLWKAMESGTSYDLKGVYAWDGGAFAVGQSGAILRYDGREWHPAQSPVGWTINDIFGFGPTSIYAVGQHPNEICHFDGTAWLPQDIGFTLSFNRSIWGTSDRNLFVSQTNGNVLHFDGTDWSSLPHVTASTARAVCGASNGEILAATSTGIVRYSR